MKAAARARLARRLTAELRAVPASTPPARATFDGGTIFLGRDEVMIMFHGIGTMFVSEVAGRVVVEAVAIAEAGEGRSIIEARHAELERQGRRLFGAENLDVREPLGLPAGKSTAVSS
jgi:hypothetical protein